MQQYEVMIRKFSQQVFCLALIDMHMSNLAINLSGLNFQEQTYKAQIPKTMLQFLIILRI